MKRLVCFFTVLCLLVGSLLFTACQKKDASAVGKKSELSIIWWGSQNRHDRTIKTIEFFMERNPNVTMTYEFSGWNDYWTKVTTMAAGGMLPDIMQHDYAFIAEWQAKGLLAPLDEYLADGTIDTSDIADSALAGGRVGGKLYGLNLGMNSQCFILDVAAFEKAGVPLPEQNWTWKEFDVICKTLHDKLGIYGMGAGLWGDQLWKSLYLSNGEWGYADDGKSLGYTDDSLYIDYMNMLKDQIAYGAYPDREVEIAQYARGTNPEQVPLITADAAMASFWSNQLIALSNASGEGRRFTLIHLPRLKKDGPPGNYLKPSQFFSISGHSSNPQDAAWFMDFFTNDVDANKILLAERGVPISSAVRNALLPLLEENAVTIFEFIDRVTGDSSPIPKPDPAGHQEIMNNVFDPQVIDPVAFGEITPEEGAALLRREATRILQGR